MQYYTYILLCRGNVLYTGQTSNLNKRLLEHSSGMGGRYTRGRLPVKLCYTEQYESRGAAMRREQQIKKMSRKKKEELLIGWKEDIPNSTVEEQV